MSDTLNRLLQASAFAAEKHRDQRRKDIQQAPYINHPIAVAELLANTGNVGDVELLMAAVLHDTVEDTATSFDELTAAFGQSVSDLVGEVTDDKLQPKERRKQLQIDNAPRKSDRAKQLKIADKICNIRDIDNDSPVNWDGERKLEYLVWAVNVVEGCRGVNAALDALFDTEIANARRRLTN